MCARVRVCACARACVRSCVRACVCVCVPGLPVVVGNVCATDGGEEHCDSSIPDCRKCPVSMLAL